MKTFCLSLLLLTVGVLAPQKTKVAPAHTHDILAVKFSPDGTQLLSYSWGDGWLILWEAKTGYLIWKTKTELVQKATERYNLEEFYWSENGEFIVTKSENRTYQSWNAATGRLVAVYDKVSDIPLKKATPSNITVTNELDDFILVDPEINASFTVKQFSRTGSVYDVSHDNTLFAEGGSWGNAAIKITEFRSGRSWYLPDPNCFFEFPSGKRIVGLCDKREISIWHGLEDSKGTLIPYGFDFGSSMILLPKTSALFPIPRHLLEKGRAIRFVVRFQNEGLEKGVEDYGDKIIMRYRESDIPEKKVDLLKVQHGK